MTALKLIGRSIVSGVCCAAIIAPIYAAIMAIQWMFK